MTISNYSSGESAGASSVGYHLTAYNGRDDGLFRAAIMESGGPVQLGALHTADYQEPRYQTILTAVNCNSTADPLACLRAVPFDTLNNAINTTSTTTWFPYLDGDFNARYGSVQLEEGDFVHVPIIIGANTDEGTAFGPYGINTEAEFVAGLEGWFCLHHEASTLLTEVPCSWNHLPGHPLPTGCSSAVGERLPRRPMRGYSCHSRLPTSCRR